MLISVWSLLNWIVANSFEYRSASYCSTSTPSNRSLEAVATMLQIFHGQVDRSINLATGLV